MLLDIDITCPAYADDIAICALHKSSLNLLLKIAYDYSKEWLFEFSVEKSVVMVWGKDYFPDIPILLGNSELKSVPDFKHVGVPIANSQAGIDRIMHERIGLAKQSLLAARGIGSDNVPVSAKILSKIYWAISVSRMTYGFEVIVIKENNMMVLEKAHRNHAKIVQNLPTMVHKPAVLAPLGWLTVRAHCAIKKMCFLWSILCHTSLYKYIALRVIDMCNKNDGSMYMSPIADMYSAFCRYKMKDVIMDAIQNNVYTPIDTMKTIIKRVVWKNEIECWKASQFLYPELECYYNSVIQISMHGWWHFAANHPRLNMQVASVISILMGSQPKSLQCNFNSNICGLCKRSGLETPIHVIFECEELDSFRKNDWPKVLNSMPNAMARQVNVWPNKQKMQFVLSGLNCQYVREWDEIYINIVLFIHRLYKLRSEKYTLIDTCDF